MSVMPNSTPDSIDSYIEQSPDPAKEKLKELRRIIAKQVPEAKEVISYGIPSFDLNGKYLIYFAGYKKHLGMYPVPPADHGFEEDYAPYKTSGKGAIQFPLKEPLPEELISKIIQYRVVENEKRGEKKM